MSQQLVNLNFQTIDGNALANGTLILRLSGDAVTDTGKQVYAGLTTSASIDSNGNCSALLWANFEMTPNDTTYIAKAYSSIGQLAWEGTITISSDNNFLLQEDGSVFLLEDGTGAILLET